jgi:TP901 family phage tail tape measure protein
VQSIAGATSDEIGTLGEKAKEMGAKTKFSATEATEAYQYMAMAGWKTEDMLNGIEGIMYLAGATGQDLASTSDIVTDALTAFGKSAQDTQQFVDVMAKTASNANTDVGMLGESFKYVAPVAGAMKYSIEDTSLALGLMANAGVKASSAGTALRSWITRMASPTKQSAEAMEALGISLTDDQGNMKDLATVMMETKGAFAKLTEEQKAQYASMLAGKTGMSGLLAVVNSSDDDFNKLTEAIQNSNGACEEMYKTANDNLAGQLTILKSSAESLAISFGELLTPYIKKAVEWVQKITEKFNGLSEEKKKMIVKIALVVASIGPMLLIFGKTVTTVGKVVSVVGKLGKALKTFGSIAGLITSPAGIVILVLGAIVVATILVIKNWDKIKKVAQKVFGYVKSVAEDMGFSFESVKEKLAPVGDKFMEIGGKLQELWTVVQPVLSKIGEIFMTVFQVYLGAVIGGAIGYFQQFINSMSTIVSGILTVFGGLIDFITGVFTGNWSKAWEGVKSIFAGTFQALVGLAKAPINGVIGIINGAISGINKIGIKIPDWVPGIGGKDFSINIPKIPTLAVGTVAWKGGLAQISERGGEIVDLPRGSRVYPHDKSVQKAYQDGARSKGAGMTVNIPKLADQIIIREDADIDKLADALGDRLEKLSDNMGGADLSYAY